MDQTVGKNMRSEAKVELKMANKRWADCVAQKFLPDWLSGKSVTLNEVCTEELQTMQDLDSQIYPDFPFKLQKAD